MRSPARTLTLAAALLLACPLVVRPDALVITKAMTATTIAEIFVEESGVVVELEIGAEGLAAFRNLLPDELYQRLGTGSEPLAERLDRLRLLFRSVPDFIIYAWRFLALVFCHSSHGQGFGAKRVGQEML